MIDFESDAQASEATPDALKRLAWMVNQLTAAQTELAALDAALQVSEGVVRQLSEEAIPDLLRECGLSELRMEDGSRVTVTDELDCGITEERRAAAHAWLRAHDLGGVIKIVLAVQFGRDEEANALRLKGELAKAGFAAVANESVHYQTLKATLKEERSQGHDVPAELFGLRPFAKTKITYPAGVKAPAKPRKRS